MTDYDGHVTGDGKCSTCGEPTFIGELDLATLDFQAEDSGIEPGTPNGPPVHWAEGTIVCPACGMRLWVQVAS